MSEASMCGNGIRCFSKLRRKAGGHSGVRKEDRNRKW